MQCALPCNTEERFGWNERQNSFNYFGHIAEHVCSFGVLETDVKLLVFSHVSLTSREVSSAAVHLWTFHSGLPTTVRQDGDTVPPAAKRSSSSCFSMSKIVSPMLWLGSFKVSNKFMLLFLTHVPVFPSCKVTGREFLLEMNKISILSFKWRLWIICLNWDENVLFLIWFFYFFVSKKINHISNENRA